MRLSSALITTLLLALQAPGPAMAAAATAPLEQEAACRTLTPAATGGPMPGSADVMVLRWFGYASYEVAYRGHVLLLDTYYDGSRPAGARTVGLRGDDVKHADIILVGHPHGDHLQDAPEVTRRTGAPIYVTEPGREYLEKQQTPATNIHYIKGGEVIKMPGYTVQTALAIHDVNDPAVAPKAVALVAAAADPPLTPEEQKRSDATGIAIGSQGKPITDPTKDVIYHGTIAYIVTFDSGFTVTFRDSIGAISDAEKNMLTDFHSKGGKVDLAIMAFTGPTPRVALKKILPVVDLYRPGIFLPAHNDEVGDPRTGIWPEMSTNGLFVTLRERMPTLRGIDPIYRAPICVNTANSQLYYGAFVH